MEANVGLLLIALASIKLEIDGEVYLRRRFAPTNSIKRVRRVFDLLLKPPPDLPA